MKDDECERRKYKGENICEYDGIFCFEEEDEGERVWMVSRPRPATGASTVYPLGIALMPVETSVQARTVVGEGLGYTGEHGGILVRPTLPS
jgi:hypothetical protein